MKKIAAIDIGTNSVLYSLFQTGRNNRLDELYFRRDSPRIGRKLAAAGKPRITEDNYRRLRAVLAKDIKHAERNGAETILLAATNPLRLAANGREIQKRLHRDLGYPVRILTSTQEAYLSFLGAVGRLGSNQTAVLIDLGGGSTELVVYRGGKRLAFVSLPEGAVSVTERLNSAVRVDPRDFPRFEEALTRYAKAAAIVQPYLDSRLVVVGGTSTALAYLKDRDILQKPAGIDLTIRDLEQSVRLLSRLSLPCRRQLLDIDRKRAEIIFGGAFWLYFLFKTIGIRKARATPKGLRHGMALDHFTGGFPA